MSGIPEIAADLHEHVRRDRPIGPGEAFAVILERAVKFAAAQRSTRQPDLCAPTPWQSGDASQCFMSGCFAAAFAMDYFIPAHSVLLIGIEFKSVPQCFLGLCLFFPPGVNLCEVRQNDPFLAVL